MILNFRLFSLTAGTTVAIFGHLNHLGNHQQSPSNPSSFALAFAPVRTTLSQTHPIRDRNAPPSRHAALGQDWDNGDYLSALSGGRDDIEEANRKYQKYAENREAMTRWKAGKSMTDGGGGSGIGNGGSSTQLNASTGGNDGAYGINHYDNYNYSSQHQPPAQQQQQQQQQSQQPPPPQQYYDQNGNPISLPMVYDQHGNLVPFNPNQPLQPPPFLQPGAAATGIIEPPLPPTTKPRPADSPRPVGYNPDTYTMSNTADVYFAQLKRDSKVRKEAWLKGDTEYANKVFEDETVKAIGNMWVDNPYTRQKNINEAKQQIEGTVRMQMADTTSRQSTSGMNYRDKLQQMKAPRGGGGKAENVASSAQHATAQSASFPPPPPPATPAASDFSQYQQQLQQQPQYQQYQQPRPQQQYQPPPPQTQQPPQPQRFQHQPVAPDPIQGSVASVETVLKMYKEASPEEREALMIPLREALLAAAGASNAAIEGNPSGMGMMPAPPVASAGVSFPRTASAPTSMAATRSGDTFDENTRRLEEVYEALGDAAGKGKFGLRNLSGAEAEELASAVGAMRTVLLDELN